MYFQQLDSDVATISKSAKGRVLFFDANGVCLLGLSETAQIQMNFDGGYIYIFQDGGGTAVFNQVVPSAAMAINSSFYKFTVVGLTDIDGRPFTALEQPDYDPEVYKEKVREAYEYLVSNIFVGCCNTGADSILWYDDEASFPATGLVDTLYVDKATPSLFIWDGSAYVAIAGGSGGGVASVTGYSVDNTDPLNPIVKAIPIAGTDAAEPVTGDIELEDTVATTPKKIYSTDGTAYETKLLFDEENAIRIEVDNIATGGNSWHRAGQDIIESQFQDGAYQVRFYTDDTSTYYLISDNPLFTGLKCPSDEQYYALSSLIQLSTMKSRIWTKAGTPTTSDDDTEGYIVGSLIQDTTNSILYRCTDNTTGAAVWTYANVQSEIIRAGGTVPSSSSRWMVGGLSGFSTSVAVNLAEKAIHTHFRVMTGSAQPASGSLTVTREFTSPTGTSLQTDVLTIAAGSAIGVYEFNTAIFNALTTDCNLKFVYFNNANILQICLKQKSYPRKSSLF